MNFEVLLADKLEEVSHLLLCGLFTVFVLSTTWAIPEVFPIVGAEQVPDDLLKGGRKSSLGTDEFESVLTLVIDDFFYLIMNTLLATFFLCFC